MVRFISVIHRGEFRMPLKLRPYETENDYWRLRQFLRDIFLLNNRREVAWQPYRLDYSRWHVHLNCTRTQFCDAVYIWETPNHQIAASVVNEGGADVHLQIHPDFNTPKLVEKMVEVAEEHLPREGKDGEKLLIIWSGARDSDRLEILENRGFKKGKSAEYARWRNMSDPINDVPIPDGYTVRALGDIDEHSKRSWVSFKAFHPNDPEDTYDGDDWYENIQRCPLYRRDLDIVAVAPDGAFASFCTAWFDDVTRTGSFEPVGTHPDHQKLGLAKAVMTEGLRRLKQLGATQAHVSSFNPPAHALYSSIGFIDYEISEPWIKIYPK